MSASISFSLLPIFPDNHVECVAKNSSSFCCSELEKREKRWKEPTFPSDNNSRALFYYRVDVGEGCSREYANASGSKHHPPSRTFISNRRGSCFPKTVFFLEKEAQEAKMERIVDEAGAELRILGPS